jgi:hypothetical protein
VELQWSPQKGRLSWKAANISEYPERMTTLFAVTSKAIRAGPSKDLGAHPSLQCIRDTGVGALAFNVFVAGLSSWF